METHRISPELGSGAKMPCLAVDTSPRVTDTGLSASDRLGFPAVNVPFRYFLSCQHVKFSVMQLFYTQAPSSCRLFGQNELSWLLLSCSYVGPALWNDRFKSSLFLLMIILNQPGESSFSKIKNCTPTSPKQWTAAAGMGLFRVRKK